MYYYLLTSGEYSDYGVEGLVVSETPIDIKAKLSEVVAWLNDNVQMRKNRSWYMEDGEKAAAFQAVGLTLIEYTEINYDISYGWDKKPAWLLVGVSEPDRPC